MADGGRISESGKKDGKVRRAKVVSAVDGLLKKRLK